ncbi:unnamed protein product [Calicophoron daubneyi]|uniref:Peptidase M1 leukotriene A4 hydrolase/aminopeptidase C-terminal domain-containing protein n=1 Tax=Calicophoron daubneyi TaxID=300641 RepID=A0AAV2TII3_CALDB
MRTMQVYRDPSSVADASKYLTKHLKFDWVVDFDSQTISGTTTLHMHRSSSGPENPPLLLDTNDLVINSVTVEGESVQWKISPNKTKALGSQLEIVGLPSKTDFDVVIVHKTSPRAPALQWLEPGLTSDKRLPFMFSQCQAIHARSLFPCQDSPGIKSSFEASVTVPKDVVAVMSGILKQQPVTSPRGSEWHVFEFEQTIPIPSYLVTIACGDLASERVGPRSSVWAERSVVHRAANEFAEIEQMISAGEELCGPYVWKKNGKPLPYFRSPTIIAGDRSLVNVIAHEIAHSWTGNLVTNSSWEHFWLNEGHTMYLERLIMERLHGSEMRQLSLAIGYAELMTEIDTLGADNPFTKLIPNLDGVDPDVSYNRIPYEKGSLFLYFLEHKFGKEKMMDWLKAYVKWFAGCAVDTPTWLEFLESHLGPAVKGEDMQLEKWFDGCGMPPWEPKFDADRPIEQCEELIKLFQSVTPTTDLQSKWEGITSTQRELTLRRLNKQPPLPAENLRIIDSMLQLSKQNNAEIRCEWSLLCIRSRYLDALDSCFEFLNSQGRMRYTRPLYRALNEWTEVRERVHANFRSCCPHMHRTTMMLVQQDLGLT